VDRGRVGGARITGVVVTMLVGKARSLAARRRTRRDGTEPTGPDSEAAEPNGRAAARETNVRAEDGTGHDGADRDGAGPDRAGPDRAGPDRAGRDGTGRDEAGRDETGLGSVGLGADDSAEDGAEDEGLRAKVAALLEPAGEPPTRLRGRDQLLARLDALVWAPDARTHVLAGPGGSGKTAVALWLARAAVRRGVPAWWVPATDGQTITVRLAELAAMVGARPGEVAAVKAGQRGAADLLWRYLEQRAPWLLVIDGADAPEALTAGGADTALGAGWLRRTQTGLVVVTSRVGDRAAWGRHTEVHWLGPLDPAAGAQVLLDLAPDVAEASALAGRLGGVPLALRQAGSLLAAGLGAGVAASNAGHTERDARAIVAATREAGLEALAGTGVTQARALLRVLSFFAAGIVIPGAMIPPQAAEGLRALAAAGLITAVPDGVIVQPLVGEASRVFTGDAARAGGVAVGMLTSAAAMLDARAAGDWPSWAALQPHVSAVYGYLGGVLGEADLAKLAKLAGTAAAAFLTAGWSVVAAELATAALRPAQRLGAEHPAVLHLRGVAARAQSLPESGDGAERELRDLLDAQLRVLGARHPDRLGTGHQLARLLTRQGDFEPAEQLLRDLLAAHARALGPDHPGTLTIWHDLGLVLAQRGHREQAAHEFAGLLAARARLLGPEHRDTRVTRRWLAHMAGADDTVRSG
jgi:Tetratricopeptide repeat